MQQLTVCSSCGQQVYVDTLSQVALVCPSCDALVQHAPAQNNPGQTTGQKKRRLVRPPAKQPAPIETPPQPTYDPFEQESAAYGSPKQNPYLKRKNGSSKTFLWVGIGGGAFGLMALLVLVITLAAGSGKREVADKAAANTSTNDAPNKQDHDDQTRTNNNSNRVNDRDSRTANRQNPVRSNPRNHQRKNNTSNSTSFQPLPSFSSATTRSRDIGYKWNSIRALSYDYRYSMSGLGKDMVFSGRSRITKSRTPSSALLDSEEKGAEGGTGTCFFVHPDGLAVTCAHVVEGASKISVRIDGKWHRARVIAIDSKNDVALLHIKITNMPTIPVADSQNLELAQSIHIIGFPIQDILGSSVKFNSGAISGFKTEHGASEFQFDANINPGNSGGPVIDQSGNVVGVASAMFQGEGMNSVAVGVQSRKVIELLENQNIRIPISNRNVPEAKNSELAKKTTPAVCLVKATGRTGMQVLDFSTTFNTGGGRTQSGNTLDSKIVVDESGEVHGSDASGALSIFLFSPSRVGIEKLDLYNGDRWQHKQVKAIIKPNIDASAIDPFGRGLRSRIEPPRGRYGLPTLPTGASIDMVLGLETIHYTKDLEDDNFATFKVTRTVQSMETRRTSSGYLRAILSGLMKFDKKNGHVASVKLTGTLSTVVAGRLINFRVNYDITESNVRNRDKSRNSANGDFGNSLRNQPSPAGYLNQRVVQELTNVDYFRAMAFTPDAKHLVTGGLHLELYNIENGRKVSGASTDVNDHVNCLSFTNKSNLLIAGLKNGEIAVFKYLQHGRFTKQFNLTGHKGKINSLALSPDDRLLLSGGEKSARLWDLETGELLRVYRNFKYPVLATYIAPSKKYGLMTDGSVLVRYELKTGKRIRRSNMKRLSFSDFAFSPNGMYLISEDTNGVKIWNTSTGDSISTLRLQGSIWKLGFSPDSKFVFAGVDKKIYQWDIHSQMKIGEYELRSNGPVDKIAVSNDGNFLAAYAGYQRESLFVFKMKNE